MVTQCQKHAEVTIPACNSAVPQLAEGTSTDEVSLELPSSKECQTSCSSVWPFRAEVVFPDASLAESELKEDDATNVSKRIADLKSVVQTSEPRVNQLCSEDDVPSATSSTAEVRAVSCAFVDRCG